MLLFVAASLIGLFVHVSSTDPCGTERPDVISETEGIISSPGYEGKGFNSEYKNCSWSIVAENSKIIHVEFLNFNLPFSSNCVFDGLIVFDGKGEESDVLLRACGQSLPKNVSSTGSFLHLIYYSEGIWNRGGFALRFKQTSPREPCGEDEATCRNQNCVNRKLICNGVDDCGDGTDEEECGYKRERLKCGRPKFEPDQSADRIVGGTKALPGSWPWQASLRISSREPHGHVCGGSLINQQWIISAAHCFRDYEKESWTVRLGKYNKNKQDKSEQLRYIKRLFIHPKYLKMIKKEERSNQKDNDIALVQLNAPVTITDVIQPVCLSRSLVFAGIRAYVTGWGDTLGTGHSGILKQVSVQIVAHRKCKKAYSKNFPIRRTMICAGNEKSGRDACKGDSGGPLVVQKRGAWYLAGIVSTGANCGDPEKPGVYTRMSSYIKWMNALLWKYDK